MKAIYTTCFFFSLLSFLFAQNPVTSTITDEFKGSGGVKLGPDGFLYVADFGTGLSQADGFQVYVIQSIPHEEAAVVWGKEVLHIRDDWVMLQEQFWDQEEQLVKTLRALEITEMDGRPVASRLRMGREDAPEEWTEVQTQAVDFDLALPENLFTLSNLRNPRE